VGDVGNIAVVRAIRAEIDRHTGKTQQASVKARAQIHMPDTAASA